MLTGGRGALIRGEAQPVVETLSSEVGEVVRGAIRRSGERNEIDIFPNKLEDTWHTLRDPTGLTPSGGVTGRREMEARTFDTRSADDV